MHLDVDGKKQLNQDTKPSFICPFGVIGSTEHSKCFGQGSSPWEGASFIYTKQG